MTPNWTPLRAELAIWRRDGLHLPLWWRDDDAVCATPALDRLLELAEALALPVHLAIIPRDADPALALALSDRAVPLVHGWAHQNHAPAGSKKAEFGNPRAGALLETAKALTTLQAQFADRLLPMFVPPWNRIAPDVLSGLAGQGYRAVSTYTPRAARQVEGLVQINTHIDPIHWKAGGGLVDPDTTIAAIVRLLQDRRAGRTDAAEPLGFLTHHLVHDAGLWQFSRDCLAALLDGGATPCNFLTLKDNLP